MRKGCQVYAVHVGYTNSKEKMTTLRSFLVIHEFKDVFLDDIPRLPQRDVDFTIEPIPGVAPVSRAPYHMSIPELIELKMKLQEFLDKKYIRLSMLPWGARVLFARTRTIP